MPADMRRVAVTLAGVAAFLNLYAPQAVLPTLAHEFNATPAEIANIMTAGTLAVALTAPFTGAVADVIGRKRVITVAMILLVIPTVMIAYAPSLHMMVFWRFVQGLMLPPIFAVTVAYIGDEWPATEATGVTGLYTMGAGFGGFTGRILTGILADTIGWREAFLVDGVLTLLLAIGMILLLPRERNFVAAPHLLASAKQMLKHLRNTQLLGTYVVGFGVLFTFIGVFTYVNFLLAAPPYNLTPTILGTIFVVYLAGMFLAPWTGRLVARYGRRRLVLRVVVVWVCGVALTLAPSLVAIIAGLTLCAACGFLAQATSTAHVTVSATEGTSSAVGLYVTFYYAGGSFGALVPGLAWTLGGWPAVVAVIMAMQIAIGIIVWTVWTPSKPRP